jgi:aminoglycoside 3-N-acetyltransferase
MPTHTGSNTDPKDWVNPPVPKEWHELIRNNYPPFRPEITPSSYVGVVPEVFRKYPNVVRSNHPTVSFAAWGKDAVHISDNHSLESGLGKGSPLQKIYDLNGKILLIGTGNESNTSLHLAEDIAEYKTKKMSTEISSIIENGEQKRVQWDEIDWDESDFIQIGEAYERGGTQVTLKKGKMGEADSLLYDQRSMVDVAVTWMEADR